MKLYFYILDSDREFNPETKTFENSVFKVRVEECEVIEKPKTYRAVTQFPKGIYIGYVKKEDIGTIFDSLVLYIVLEEPNYQFAKEAFLKRYNKEICRLENTIAMYEKMISAIEDCKGDTKC